MKHYFFRGLYEIYEGLRRTGPSTKRVRNLNVFWRINRSVLNRAIITMPKEIVLLTGGVEAPHLSEMLLGLNPALFVTAVETREQLIETCQQPGAEHRRLIAYCTNVIVPAEALDAVMAPAYNFHPGPPEYPGACSAGFAIYEGARTFGVSAHEMAERVDAGEIVGVGEFDIPENTRFMDLELLAYGQLFQLFARLAPDLALSDEPLAKMDVAWGGRKTSKADAERMKEITADMSEDEIRLRWRAFG
jgi:methionyl-tRNA formyltransferase